MKRPILTPEHEEKWNEHARVFVETFQKVIMGIRSDSLAGFRTFEALRQLDTNHAISNEEWLALIQKAR